MATSSGGRRGAGRDPVPARKCFIFINIFNFNKNN
jgi:hypothetical protein